MRAVSSICALTLAVSSAAAKPKRVDPSKTPDRPAIVVQVLPAPSDTKDPLLLHVRVSTPPVTSLAAFCRAVSGAASIPLESEPDLAGQKLFVEVRDQPLGRVLEDVAGVMNARLEAEPHGSGPAQYRIRQLKEQKDAETEIIGVPMKRLLAGLQALRDGKGPYGLPQEIFELAKRRPGFVSLLRKLTEAEWRQLLAGRTILVTSRALLAPLGGDLAGESASLRSHAAAEGLNVPTGGPNVASALLRLDNRDSGHTPTLYFDALITGGGLIGGGLVSLVSLQSIFPDAERFRKLLQIPPSPDPLPASPEIDLSGLKPELPFNEVVAEIARRAQMEMIMRQFRHPAVPPLLRSVTYDRKAPALELLNEIWKYGPIWGKRDGIIVAVPLTWSFLRQSEIPDEKLDRWLDVAHRNQLSNWDVMDMAQLTDPQILRLQTFLMPAAYAFKYRMALRAWEAMSVAQQQAAASPQGVPVITLDAAAKQALARAATDQGLQDPTMQPGAILYASDQWARDFRIRLSFGAGGRTELVLLLAPNPRNYYPTWGPGRAGEDQSKWTDMPKDQSGSRSF